MIQESRGTGLEESGGAQSGRRFAPIMPGATIGVLGGGQLGRMMAHAGSRLGYRFVALDPAPDAPCGQVAEQIVAAYDDREAARVLASRSDVITYEFENVDADVAAMLMDSSYVPQGSALLYTTQHRLREKRAIEAAGVRVAPYAEIRSLEDLREAAGRLGLPAVLKTVTGGYDGKGQVVLREAAELEHGFAALAGTGSGAIAAGAAESTRAAGHAGGADERAVAELEAIRLPDGRELVLEQFIPFTMEMSVIAARSPQGEIRTFAPAENVHVDNILHLSIVPARGVPDGVAAAAQELAVRIAKGLDVVGLIAVELFVTPDGGLYVNELAPRPHNSGHYTMEACRTSQFEQHVRAVCGLPLGGTELLTPVVMVNVLGEHVQPLLEWLARPDEAAQRLGVEPKVHLYGKAEAKAKRKMGHVNVLAPSVDAALAWIAETGIWADEACRSWQKR